MVNVEQANIRGLDIDKAVKGFALQLYVFRADCQESTTSGDSIRWYQEDGADLTATTPMRVANVARLAQPVNMEVNWTRNLSYTRKYINEGNISMEDIRTADIDVLARTLLRLTRAVVKQVDSRIWDVMTNNRKGNTGASTEINLVTSSGAWNDKASDPVRDILAAKRVIQVSGGYDPKGASLYLSPLGEENLITWLVKGAASAVPSYNVERLKDGTITSFLGLNVKVSTNVTADYAAIVIPKTACTWKSAVAMTSDVTKNPGIGTRIRVWEDGEAILTDPLAVCLISNTAA